MSEGKKTGIFWCVAVAMTGIASFVAWPRATESNDVIPGTMLFEQFSDPLAAASLKVVTFDEEQGQLDTFEVRKDRGTGVWTIPSRDGYPADAIEQMKDAANALVGVKILDLQTSNAEDHDDLGVVEPKVESLEVGDEGVGRLVTFKDEKQETLASLIIGDPVKTDETKRYVRIPNQDPVYVVKFDDSPLTTKFTDWIEDDLLQMSSIDIRDVEIKDYTASLGARGIALTRNYTAMIQQDGTDWKLDKLLEYDPNDPRIEPKEVTVGEEKELNKTKLNEMKNALDDLKIVGVYRKPEGVSATLAASADLVSDQDAVTSLAQRGFYPVNIGPKGDAEILSANGELTVSLDDGVKYLLRFGNIAGVSGEDAAVTDEADEDPAAGGVNRYMFLTTVVDESRFPAPDLQEVPETWEQLDAMMNPVVEEEGAVDEAESTEPESASDTEMTKEEDSEPEADATEEEAGEDAEMAESSEKESEPSEESPEKETAPEGDEAKSETPEMKEEPKVTEESKPAEKTETPNTENPKTEKPDPAPEDVKPTEEPMPAEQTGEGQGAGQGEASDSGQAQAADEDAKEDSESDSESEEPAESEPAEEGTSEEDDSESEEMTDEERQELLEAEQEKITKDNQRKLDERKDQIEKAQKRVKELNERFADWYYVIPEATYTELRIQRDDLFKKDASESEASSTPDFSLPNGPINPLPGFPQQP